MEHITDSTCSYHSREYNALVEYIKSDPTNIRLESLFIFLRFSDDAAKNIYYDFYESSWYVPAWLNHRGVTLEKRFYPIKIDIETLDIHLALRYPCVKT